MWIATADQCREIDRRAIEEFEIPSRDLMEAAGEAIFQHIATTYPSTRRVVVCCGKGNNGGDGFVVARLIKGFEIPVECYCVATEPSELSTDARVQFEAATKVGIPVSFAGGPNWDQLPLALEAADIIVDALLGTGARGAPSQPYAECISEMNLAAKPIVGVDIPSGIDADTGQAAGAFVRATSTVTIGLPKPFLFQNVGQIASGKWEVAPINFPPVLLEQPTQAFYSDVDSVRKLVRSRKLNSHKGQTGSVLIVAGSHQYRGAAHLAARAALRAGAGLVTLAAPDAVCDAVAASLPEVILMSHGDFPVKKLLADAERFDAAVFGPGLSTNVSVVNALRSMWANWKLPCVIDADALNAIATGLVPPQCECVLTPHPGEMARLLQTTTQQIQLDRYGAVREASNRFGQTVLLKGANTLVTGPGQPIAVNSTGNAGMATGGMGDVLSGVIGTLLAQGRSSFEAAVLGTYLHGAAADLCQQRIGEFGYFASEVADALPTAHCKLTSP